MHSKQNSTKYGRFKSLEWFKPLSESRIFIGGAGGIGSWLGLFLARAGADIVVLDNDHVDESNLAGQCYGPKQIGASKVDGLKEVILSLTGETINGLNTKIVHKDLTDGAQWVNVMESSKVTCVTFDNIATRGMVFHAWLEANKKTDEPRLFIDCRMGAENGEVFVVTSDNEEAAKAYIQTLFDDAEVPDAPCTAKATTHCGALIASLAVAQIANWFNNLVSIIQRPVTGHFSFQLMVMQFNKEKLKVQEDVIVENSEQRNDSVQSALVPT